MYTKEERIADAETDLKDAKKSLEEADNEVQEAIRWKYKQMEAVVKAFNHLEEVKAEK